VPADPSSPIPAALAHLTQTDPRELQDSDAPHLLAYLATVPDPRAARGRRYRLVAILGLAAAAVLAGARSIAAIAGGAAEAPQPVRAALGARRDAPGHFAVPAEAAIRRTLARLDPEALAGAIGAWLTDYNRAAQPPRRPRAVAVDGKTLRGARHDGRQVHLLACMDHASRAVLAHNARSTAPPARSLACSHCWPTSTWPMRSSPPTRSRPTRRPPSSWSLTSRPTTCWSSRPTSPPCWTAAPACPGSACPCWTAPATAAASSSAPSRR
jgi:hypothetical protein